MSIHQNSVKFTIPDQWETKNLDTIDGPRACLRAEFQEVVSLINQTFRKGTSQDIRTDYPLIFDPSKLEYMRVIKMDGVIVSQVPVAPRTVKRLKRSIHNGNHQRHHHASGLPKKFVGPLENTGIAGEVLNRIFPFYFPVWKLDHA